MHLSSRSRRIPTATRPLRRHREESPCPALNLLLQCGHCVSFHNSLRRLCLDMHLFAEDIPNTSLRCWLCPGLDAAQTWDCENACLLHLFVAMFTKLVNI